MLDIVVNTPSPTLPDVPYFSSEFKSFITLWLLKHIWIQYFYLFSLKKVPKERASAI